MLIYFHRVFRGWEGHNNAGENENRGCLRAAPRGLARGARRRPRKAHRHLGARPDPRRRDRPRVAAAGRARFAHARASRRPRPTATPASSTPPSLRLLRFSVEKRANGQPYLKVTSIGPINEPFVDVLIEVTWPAGRLQREYPILLDPPGIREARAAPPAVAPRLPRRRRSPQRRRPPRRRRRLRRPPAAPAPDRRAFGEGRDGRRRTGRRRRRPASDTYGPVEKGETLRKIAGEVKPSNVSLEQMLVALYRENKAAFIDNNMNRLKTGQILRCLRPTKSRRSPTKEANQEIRTHVANWKAYREQLAGGVASMPARAESSHGATGTRRHGGGRAACRRRRRSQGRPQALQVRCGQGRRRRRRRRAQDRVNALQEEVTAKDKALKEVAVARRRPGEADPRHAAPARPEGAALPASPPKPRSRRRQPPKVAGAPSRPKAPKPAEPPKPARSAEGARSRLGSRRPKPPRRQAPTRQGRRTPKPARRSPRAPKKPPAAAPEPGSWTS